VKKPALQLEKVRSDLWEATILHQLKVMGPEKAESK